MQGCTRSIGHTTLRNDRTTEFYAIGTGLSGDYSLSEFRSVITVIVDAFRDSFSVVPDQLQLLSLSICRVIICFRWKSQVLKETLRKIDYLYIFKKERNHIER